jgi:DHA1 family bicyclomycin/chloramphenicol resistance-like MFS transporter
LLLGLAAALAGSLLCQLARNHSMLLAGRVLQGAGFAAGSVIWRLFARQGRGPEALDHLIARIGALTPMVSMLTPVVGSQLVIAAGPRLVFAVTALLAAGLMLWTLRQGKGEVRRGGPGYWAGYAQVLRDPVAQLILTALVLNSAYTYAFLSIAPHLMMREFGLGEAAYGYAMAAVPVAMMLSGLLNDRLARQWDERRFLLAGGLGVALAASALSGLVAVGAAGPLSVIALIVLGVPFGAMVNLAGMMGVMRRFDQGGGAASSAIGLSMLGGAFVDSTVMIGVNSAGARWPLPLLALGLALGLGTTALARRNRARPTAPAAQDTLAQRRCP